MLKLCPGCNKISQAKQSFLEGNIYLAIAEFIAVAIILVMGQLFGSKILGIFFGIFFLLTGIMNLVQYYKGGNICPSCKNKSMLPLDNPEAIKQIKEHDLNIPEGASDQTKAPST